MLLLTDDVLHMVPTCAKLTHALPVREILPFRRKPFSQMGGKIMHLQYIDLLAKHSQGLPRATTLKLVFLKNGMVSQK